MELLIQLQSLRAVTCIHIHHNSTIIAIQGIKAVYVAELPSTKERISDGRRHNEFWGDYPDIWDEPWGRVHRPFDSRAAMAPFVAHQLLKREGVDYKWMLYGDDDTMWFMSAVLDLLREYDSELPYFISGAVSVHARHTIHDAPISVELCSVLSCVMCMFQICFSCLVQARVSLEKSCMFVQAVRHHCLSFPAAFNT